MKFTKNTIEEIKKDIKKSARETRQNVDMMYDIKKKEIEETIIPKHALEILTPEQIRRSERIGLIIGVLGILGLWFLVVLWLMGLLL